jgi:hypothetical protein
MKTYTCVCGQLLFFQNTSCVNCGRELGFLPESLLLTSLDPQPDGLWRPTAESAQSALYRKCQNYSDAGVCNWMVGSDDADPFCVSCRLNQIIPDLTVPANKNLWAVTELAKRRLIYSALALKLPLASKKEDPQHGLAFRFLADTVNPDGSVVRMITGHEDGTITVNVDEADDAKREKVRDEMNEPYRTLLGDFRHESGHYYWDRLVRDTKFLEGCRALFGDDRTDYGEALKLHYESGAPSNWQESFISAYATSHPWEDWAESWAHFLHIQDTLEVAHDFGLTGKRIFLEPSKKRRKPWLSSKQHTFDEIIQAWSELAVALNSINRSMGLQDLYPFVLSAPAIAKLEFVYRVVVESAEKSSGRVGSS